MDKEHRDSLMETCIRETMSMVNSMDLENISGKTEVFTKGISKAESATGMESGKKVINLEISMKAISSVTKKKVMEYILGDVDIFIREIIATICDMDMERCIGRMEVSIKAIGKTIRRTDRVNCLMAIKI